jgi:hypothetical protein
MLNQLFLFYDFEWLKNGFTIWITFSTKHVIRIQIVGMWI